MCVYYIIYVHYVLYFIPPHFFLKKTIMRLLLLNFLKNIFLFTFFFFRIVKPAIMLVFDVRSPLAIWRRVWNLKVWHFKSKRPHYSLQCISNFGHPGLHIEHCVDCVVLRGVAVFLSDGGEANQCRCAYSEL